MIFSRCRARFVKVYVVMSISSGVILYNGRDLDEAANALGPDTCFGIGRTPEYAIAQAHAIAETILDAQSALCVPPGPLR
jgi:hypothetical protein